MLLYFIGNIFSAEKVDNNTKLEGVIHSTIDLVDKKVAVEALAIIIGAKILESSREVGYQIAFKTGNATRIFFSQAGHFFSKVGSGLAKAGTTVVNNGSSISCEAVNFIAQHKCLTGALVTSFITYKIYKYKKRAYLEKVEEYVRNLSDKQTHKRHIHLYEGIRLYEEARLQEAINAKKARSR